MSWLFPALRQAADRAAHAVVWRQRGRARAGRPIEGESRHCHSAEPKRADNSDQDAASGNLAIGLMSA